MTDTVCLLEKAHLLQSGCGLDHVGATGSNLDLTAHSLYHLRSRLKIISLTEIQSLATCVVLF